MILWIRSSDHTLLGSSYRKEVDGVAGYRLGDDVQISGLFGA